MKKILCFFLVAVFIVAISANDPRCAQIAESGRCYAFMPRFAYDGITKKCVRFIYGGCGGNDNRFETIAECQAACEI